MKKGGGGVLIVKDLINTDQTLQGCEEGSFVERTPFSGISNGHLRFALPIISTEKSATLLSQGFPDLCSPSLHHLCLRGFLCRIRAVVVPYRRSDYEQHRVQWRTHLCHICYNLFFWQSSHSHICKQMKYIKFVTRSVSRTSQSLSAKLSKSGGIFNLFYRNIGQGTK